MIKTIKQGINALTHLYYLKQEVSLTVQVGTSYSVRAGSEILKQCALLVAFILFQVLAQPNRAFALVGAWILAARLVPFIRRERRIRVIEAEITKEMDFIRDSLINRHKPEGGKCDA